MLLWDARDVWFRGERQQAPPPPPVWWQDPILQDERWAPVVRAEDCGHAVGLMGWAVGVSTVCVPHCGGGILGVAEDILCRLPRVWEVWYFVHPPTDMGDIG